MVRKYKRVEPAWHTCKACGKAFKGRANRLYCSNVCRVRAQRLIDYKAYMDEKEAVYQALSAAANA